MGMHDTQPSLEPSAGKQPSKFLGKKPPLSQKNAEVSRVVNVEDFLASLPASQVQHFSRVYTSPFTNIDTGNRPIETIYTVETGRALILTFVKQQWFTKNTPTTYEEIPAVSGLIEGPLYMNLYVNTSSILEAPSEYNEPALPAIRPNISGVLERGVNILDFGRHRTALLVRENERLEAEYLQLFTTAGVPISPNPKPEAILITLKGFTLPMKVLQEASILYGI